MHQICELIGKVSSRPSALDLSEVTDHLLLAAWALFCQAAASSSDEQAHPPSDIMRVRAFQESVEAHLHRHESVDGHAARLNISTRTLARACQRVLGTTPKQHLDGLLALEAKRRLAHSQAPIESIAESLGFSEATNFTKFFVRLTGQTPRAFRTHTTLRGPNTSSASSERV